MLNSERRHVTLLSISLVLGVLLSAIVVGVFMVSLGTGIDDAYALWGAAEMLIDYMQSNDGRWPGGWDDLEPQFKENNGRVGGWSFARFQDRIGIDFEVTAEELCGKSVNSPNATFRVIWPKHESGVRVGNDPNQILRDYFRSGGRGVRAPLGIFC